MASINLSGILTRPDGEPDVGAVVRFTHYTTTGNTVKYSYNELIIPPDGLYNLDIEYGKIRIDYESDYRTERFIAFVVVNQDSTATSIPELLNASVPPTDEQLLEFQSILADTVSARDETIAVSVSLKQVDTFTELEALSPSEDGLTPKRYICVERANAEYLLQPSVYVALAGDVTFANGRVGALQIRDGGWFIEDFGAKKATDSTQAIKNAIERAGSSPVFGNSYAYWVSEPITMRDNNASFGAPIGQLTLYDLSLTNTTLTISPDSPELGGLISGVELHNIKLNRISGSSGAIALQINAANSPTIANLDTLNSHTGVSINGIKDANFSNLRLFAGDVSGYVAGTSLIVYDSYPLTSGGKTHAYTTNITNLDGGCGFKCDHFIDIKEADSFQITTGYLASPYLSHINIEPDTAAKGITSVLFSGLYFDGVNNAGGGALHCVTVPSHVGAFVNDVKFSSVRMGNTTGDIISIDGAITDGELIGCELSNSELGGVVISGGASSKFKVTGGNIDNCSTSAVDVGAIKSFSIVGTGISSSATGVKLSSTAKAVVSDLTFDAVTTEFDIFGVATLTGGACVSDVNGIVDVNSGSFTPQLRINSSATGIVHTTQNGTYVRNGNVVTFTIELVISSKGSESGAVSVTSLPFAAAHRSTFAIQAKNVTAGVGNYYLNGRVNSGATTVFLFDIGSSGVQASITDDDITNTTELVISGSYIAQ